ncbi:MAG: hypothetical protein MSA89_05325 [Clostridium sp.]|nr:hypothetical protein [Clostridium sp.]
MKKLYNKALFYQYLYTGKWPILFGVIIFFIVTYGETQSMFSILKINISSLYSNKMEPRGILYLFIICVALFVIYIFITGFNKRNNLTFLNSSPFTRKEIKQNEILFLLLSLIIFVFIFLYVNICLYYNQRELLSISSMYISTLVNDTLRLFYIGFLFIIYLEFMDMIFSNTVFTIISMMIFPFTIVIDFLCILSILELLGVYIFSNYSINIILSKISESIRYLTIGILSLSLIEKIIIYLVLSLIIVLGFIFIDKINKKFTINNINKFFNFIIVKKIFLWITSLSIVNFIFTIIIGSCMNKFYYEKFYYENPYYTGITPSPFSLLEGIVLFMIISIAILLISKFLVERFNKLIEQII